ncbi:MAG: phosphoglucosamine mutase [Lysobacteraceae bacterium]|nr:MAG: phosphoglucosamine mutase [Xanthomonadaceae bacterium]
MSKRYFGTDGIRGRVGELPITADFVLRLGHAAGTVLATTPSRTVVIGKDTRISGYMFESALEAGLSAAGCNIKLLGPMPTPAVAHLTRSLKASAGIVISASHNPHFDNGFKFFSARGEKLAQDVQDALEKELDAPFTTVPSERLGKAERVDDAQGRYIEFCKNTVSSDVQLSGLKMVLDCAHGATYQVAPRVFREMGAEVVAIGVHPDGLNINQGCGSTHLETLRSKVLETGADLGIALDGDGDRVLMVDDQGNTIDGDQLTWLLAVGRKRRGLLKGGVVGTVMTNVAMEKALAKEGIPFLRSAVGDRFVHQRLVEQDWQLGGEGSGHIILRDKATTGDGIVSALEVLETLVGLGQSLAEVLSSWQKYPQHMINVPIVGHVDIDANDEIKAVVSAVEDELGSSGRLILRPSGTEPVVRVTVEAEVGDQAVAHAQRIADVIQSQFQ